MKFTTMNVMLGILILASVVTSYKLHQVVKRYDALKVQVTEVVGEVKTEIADFTKLLDKFELKYGDEVAESLKLEANIIKAEASLYADSLKVKAGEWLNNN